MSSDIDDIKILITKHTIDRIREREIIQQKNIELYLETELNQKTITLHEGKHRDNYLYLLPSDGFGQHKILLFIRKEDNLFVSQTSYRTFMNLSKLTTACRYFVTDVEIPKLPKTQIQLIEEEIENLETRKKNITEIDVNVHQLKTKIGDLQNKKKKR